VGIGHLYQGRYKSFPVQSGTHYLTLMQYVESNPLRAKLVQSSRDWPYGSLAIRTGMEKAVGLSAGPIELPKRWPALVDKYDPVKTGEIMTCIRRGRPMGEPKWIAKTASQLSLESSLHPNGRPKKEK
jgi:putative transposase